MTGTALGRMATELADSGAQPAPRLEPSCSASPSARPHVVVIGAGFGGLNAAMSLAGDPVRLTVIDRSNYHLFQPLLYQVATAALSPSQIAFPIRRILRRQKNATVLMETVRAIDPISRTITTCTRTLVYDYLVIATGARHAYFGRDDWESRAPGLKSITDATEIRARILTAFEKAEVAETELDRQRLLTFAVIGAGPTGVELAGAIAELARRALRNDFRNINPASARVYLIEAGKRVLPGFQEMLSQSATKQMEALGVRVVTGTAVTDCREEGIALSDGRFLPTACIIWAAGVMASPAAGWLKAQSDSAGRIIVGPDLTLPGHPEIYVIGDTASVHLADGRTVPGVAPAAKQMGRYAAQAIVNRIDGRPTQEFRYRDHGSMATIGRKAAIADLGRVQLSGFSAWLVWSFVHLLFLVGFRNRILVMMDWIWSYVTFERGARLITGRSKD